MDHVRLLDLCAGHPIYVQTHNFPDPDALAAGFGLCTWFRMQGCDATLCYDGQLDKRACKKMVELFSIEAVPLSQLPELEEDSVLVCVDTQAKAGNITLLSHPIDVCIDHHPTFAPAEYRYEDLRPVGSCASLVTDYYVQAGIRPDSKTASVLLYGIKIDTRNFSRGVTELDIRMFEFLNQICDGELLRRITSRTISYADLKAYANAIETIQVYGTAGFAEIEFPCSDDLIAMISDFFLTLDELDLSVVFCRQEDGLKISVRSDLDAVHAGDWTRLALEGYGIGGGHPYMAGGRITLDELAKLGQYPEELIRNRFLKMLPRVQQSK